LCAGQDRHTGGLRIEHGSRADQNFAGGVLFGQCLNDRGSSGNGESDFDRSRASPSASLGDARGLVRAIRAYDCDQS